MKATLKAQLRSQSVAELTAKTVELDKEIALASNKKRAQKLEDRHLVSKKRDEMAVIKTIIRELELSASALSKPATAKAKAE